MDWDFNEMKMKYGADFLADTSTDEPFKMEDFDDYFDSPKEAVRSVIYGGRYRHPEEDFNLMDVYFRFNSAGNVESFNDIEGYLDDNIDEDLFYEWCKEYEYI